MRILTTSILLSFALPLLAQEMGDDGLHKESWMHQTFGDMREDQADARADDKILMVIWEQRGCIYCDKMHKEVFPEEDINTMLNDDYYVVQYNLFGDVEITDFDGEVLSERDMANKWGVMFTPTMMFFPEDVPEDQSAKDASVVTMPGAFGKWTTKNLLTWIDEGGYQGDENFQKYHARKIQEARDAGEILEE